MGVLLFVAGLVAGIWLWSTEGPCAALTAACLLWLGSGYCWVTK